MVLMELMELNNSYRQQSGYVWRRSREMWNSGEVLKRIENLEVDLKRCHDLFTVRTC